MRQDGPQSRSVLYGGETNLAKESKIINIMQQNMKIRQNISDINVFSTQTTWQEMQGLVFGFVANRNANYYSIRFQNHERK
jgi:hypothetical protein